MQDVDANKVWPQKGIEWWERDFRYTSTLENITMKYHPEYICSGPERSYEVFLCGLLSFQAFQGSGNMVEHYLWRSKARPERMNVHSLSFRSCCIFKDDFSPQKHQKCEVAVLPIGR